MTRHSENSFLFENGDRVCFIGDSITHGNFYMGYIYDYYLTRYPDRKIIISNCGIAGDRASLAVNRLEYDVLVNEPNKAVLMFGVNDIDRNLYNSEPPSQETLEAREQALKNFRDGMEKIVHSLVLKNIEVILVAATPYDQTAQIEEYNNFGCNDALVRCADIVNELARQYGCCSIDLHSPLNEINMSIQKINPCNTIIGPDRIHPSDEGNLLMAYYFLKQQGALSQVASLKLDFVKREAFNLINCEVNSINTEGRNISFNYKPHSFPFYVDKVYKTADKLAAITQEMNSEIIAVTGLPSGEYELAMEGVVLGVYSQSSLNAGVNIAAIPHSPRQKQSEMIHKANLLRHQWEQKLRTIRFVEYNPRNHGIDMANSDVAKQFLENDLQIIKNEPYYGYFREQTDLYYSLKPCENEILQQIERYRDEIYLKNTLAQYRVSIRSLN